MKMYINAGISLSTGVTFVGEAEKLLIPDNMYQYRIKRRNMTKKKENTAQENAEREITEKQKDGRIEVSCEMEVTLKIIGGNGNFLSSITFWMRDRSAIMKSSVSSRPHIRGR